REHRQDGRPGGRGGGADPRHRGAGAGGGRGRARRRVLVRRAGGRQPDQHGGAVVEDEAVLGRGHVRPLGQGGRQGGVRVLVQRRVGRRGGDRLPVAPDGFDEL